jgi:hypothetical protein
VIGLIRELLSAARDGYLDAMQDHAPQGLRVEQATDSWFAPAIPVSPPTGEVRVRRARSDEQVRGPSRMCAICEGFLSEDACTPQLVKAHREHGEYRSPLPPPPRS